MQVRDLFNAEGIMLSGGVVAVAAIRVLMAPFPNVEPVMLFTIASGLAFGPAAGFFMGAGSMLLSNLYLASGPLSFPWIFHMPLVMVYTSLAYGAAGLFAGFLGMVKKGWNRLEMSFAALFLTFFYDFFTAFFFALQFYGPAGLPAALLAQVPFTLLHTSNALIVFFFGPYVLKAFEKAKNTSLTSLLQTYKTKS